MEFEATPLPGVFLIKPMVFDDHRGHFFEFFNHKVFADAGLHLNFVQDNQSMSHRGVLRGLHFQTEPHQQGKLVRVVYGSVRDVVVDMRRESSSFGKHFTTDLSSENKSMLWIPPGCAHGFYTLEDNTIFTYKCTGYYNKQAEKGIRWNDQTLSINWGTTDPVISEKDSALPTWDEYWR